MFFQLESLSPAFVILRERLEVSLRYTLSRKQRLSRTFVEILLYHYFFLFFSGSKYFAHSLTFTESDDDSDNESTVFDKKRLGNGSINGHNGSANGKVPRYKSSQM